MTAIFKVIKPLI